MAYELSYMIRDGWKPLDEKGVRPDENDNRARICAHCDGVNMTVLKKLSERGTIQMKAVCRDCGYKSPALRQARRSTTGSEDFYYSREWYELRHRVLKKYGARCMTCGRTAQDKVIIDVAHRKSRFLYPELALDEANLIVKCRPCNLGQGLETDDWTGVA